MGLPGSIPVSSMAALVFVLGLVLNVAVLCNGGKTSTFVRNVEKTVDMPLDSDVFRVPPGYNAPQQVYCLAPLSQFVHFPKNFMWASFVILIRN